MDASDLEVRCGVCDAGYAAGTRTCFLCGNSLGRPRGIAHTPHEADDAVGPVGHEEEDASEVEELRRAGLWSNLVPALAAIGLVLSYVLRACEGD